MAKQTIVWTALPNGVANGRLQLSAFVSPRLVPEGSEKATLETFPLWQDWAAQALSFRVSIGGTELPDPARVEVKRGQERRADLWRKLFPPAKVTVDAPPPGGAALSAEELPYIRSVPTAALRSFARDEYAALAAHYPNEVPTGFTFNPPEVNQNANPNGEGEYYFPRLGTAELDDETRQFARGLIKQEFRTKGFFEGGDLRYGEGPYDVIPAYQVNMLLAEQFQNRDRYNNREPLLAGEAPKRRWKANEAPSVDFHKALGALGEYPALLRVLGLVWDLSVPLPAGLPLDNVDVKVVPTWTGQGANPHVGAITSATITSATFAAVVPEGSVISGGLLALDRPEFDVVDVDPDSTATGILNFAGAVSRISYDDTKELARPQPAPSLQTRGLALNHGKRASGLRKVLEENQQLEQGLAANALEDRKLNADHLMRGIRVDVWDDKTEKWHSLCLRKGAYTFTGETILFDDEGTVLAAATEQPDDDTIYLHESLTRWIGYSLVAPRPGVGPTDDGQLVSGDSDPGDIFDLKTVFKAAPGTLPKLRFGRTYRLRARMADLAGNGLTLATVPAGSTAVTRAVTFHRFEPVQAPYVLLRNPRTEGESLETVVIRSNFDQPGKQSSERHVAPHKIAVSTAEQHGLFDVPKNPLEPGGMSKAVYRTIIAKDSGSFANEGEVDPTGQGQRFYDANQLTLPYLPDVLARGAAFLGLPGLPEGEVFTVDFDHAVLQKWPNTRPFRIVVKEGTGRPEFHPVGRYLTVEVPKGRTFDVQYSSKIDANGRGLLGPWQWLVDYLADPANPRPSDVTIEKLEAWALDGRLWQLTPFRTLTLVHAVRQPMIPPAFAKPIAVRKPGETSAAILDKVTVDRRSTSKVALLANWSERVDVASEVGPRSVPGQALAFTTDVDSREFGTDVIPLSKRHEFHDTKYRKVSYELVATSRYAEYFVERRKLALSKTAPTLISDKGIVPASDAVISTEVQPPVTYVRGTDFSVDYAKGTVIALSDRLDGVAVEVAYVAPPVTRSSTEAKPAVAIDVPSSARPVAPDVAYVVPTFGWERSEAPASLSSTRRGNGLRVYLRRPWYSSGDGEQLAVVLSGKDERPSTRMEHFVSTWGADPAFASADTTNAPLVSDFPLAIRPKSKLKLAESDKDTTLTDPVAVVPHAVGYDEDKQLYYADITVKSGLSYQPFVKLTLARYQPISVTGVELSTVVQAQFAQLNPDRSFSVVFNSGGSEADVAVSGLTYKPTLDFAKAAVVKVLVQRKIDPSLQGDLAWTTVSDATLTANNPLGTWTGKVTLPGARGSEPFRLVVQEYEVPSHGENQRLVYADAIEV